MHSDVRHSVTTQSFRKKMARSILVMMFGIVGCGPTDPVGTGGSGNMGGGGQGGADNTGGGGQGGAGNTGGGGQGGTGGMVSAKPGTIEVTVNDVTGATGLILLGVTKSAVLNAALCQPIDATPFSHTEVFHPFSGMDPCAEVPGAQEFPAGQYNLAIGTIMGGSKVFEKCAALSVTVDGNQQVTAPAFADWKPPPYGAMDICNLQ